MRTETIEIYKFNELSEEAKEKAHQNFLNSEREYFWIDENLESLKKGLEYFDFNLSDWSINYHCATNAYLKIESNHYDNQEELSGIRLWKFLQDYIHGYRTNSLKYPHKNGLLEGNCPFTGYCADENFLDPIRKFIEKPTDKTFQELMEECAYEVMNVIELDYDYQNSIEFFSNQIS